MKRIIFLLIAINIFCSAQDTDEKGKLIILPYGFFKLDMSYDSDLMSAGNFPRWAIPNSKDAIPTTNVTANQGSQPSTDQRRLAKSGRRRDQRQFVPQTQAVVKPPNQMRAPHEVGPDGRDIEFCF